MSNSNSRIARPLSITSILQASSINTTNLHSDKNRKRQSSISEYERKKLNTIKRPTSRLSKSHSMHRLVDQGTSDDEDEVQHSEGDYLKYQQEHRRALLSRATTTPMPKPSTLIKRFSSDNNNSHGVLVTCINKTKKSASSTTSNLSKNNNTNSNISTIAASSNSMKRSSSLMNPIEYTTTASRDDIYTGGGNMANDFRIGQKVIVPSLSLTGTVKFFGELKFIKGNYGGNNWVGIELDKKGAGKNDGSIQGVRYFTCAKDSGLFITSSKVILLVDKSSKKTLTPRTSKTTTTATRKSMVTTQQRSHNTTIVPSKSARTISSSHRNSNNNNSQKPVPTRSSPSSVINNNKSITNNNVTNINKSKSTATPIHQNKSSKSTTTSTTSHLKKSSSLSTAAEINKSSGCHHRHHNDDTKNATTARKSSSSFSAKTTKSEVDELKRVSALLEISRQEQMMLSKQMDGKEAAWERLLSAKESYAVRVQEKDDEIMRLKKEFEKTLLTSDQLVKLTAEKESAISRACMSEAMEKQHVKVIERLNSRIRTLQEENNQSTADHKLKMRDNAAQINQLRKQLSDHENIISSIEKESSDLRELNIRNQRSYESSLLKLKQENDRLISIKDTQIEKLQFIVNDLSSCMNPSSPLTPIIFDDTKKRLEAQLELSTKELDKEREIIKSMSIDINQLKGEIKRLHRLSASSNFEFYSLREELENEIKDKSRIMEERNAALESQSRTEDENERIRLTLHKTQHDLNEVLKKLALIEKQSTTTLDETSLIEKNRELEIENERLSESQKQTEHECMRLMDELLAIEKVEENSNENSQGGGDEKLYKREIEQLKLQVIREAKRYQDLEQSKRAKVEQLNKEVSDLESLVEKKVFDETELEEAIESEKKKVRLLENKLREQQEDSYNNNSKRFLPPLSLPMSPTSPHYSSVFNMNKKRSSTATATSSLTLMTSSSLDTVSDCGNNFLESMYCEICEEYGHEVISCNAYIPQEHQDEEEIEDILPSSSYYCVNCDVFGVHPTEICPNQDETF